MEQHGFIHDMLDVKVLILYIMSRVQYPVNVDKVYELAYQDDCVSYFDVAQALPEMVGPPAAVFAACRQGGELNV